MQTKKNQSVQGCFEPPSVGSGLSTSVEMGEMIPGGQVVQTGSVVVVSPGGGVVASGAVVKIVTRLQSTDTTPVVGPKKLTTLVVGQLKPIANVVGVAHSVKIVVDGVAKTIVSSGGHVTVVGVTAAGKLMVVTVAPVAVTVDVMPV